MKKTLFSSILLASLAVQPAIADIEMEPFAGVKYWQETQDQRMDAWFREARFGMFIHWGLYSPAAGMWDGQIYKQHYAEWIQNWARVDPMEYQSKTREGFNGSNYDAAEWAAMAKDAGMKYAVLTTKHHEGFTLFNSEHPYSVENAVSVSTNISDEGRDFVGEYTNAFRDAGLKVGYYYSLLDWQHPDAYPINMPGYDWNKGPREHEKYVDYVHTHLEELLTKYGEIDCLWYDFSTGAYQGKSWRSRELLEKMAKWQPNIVMNNRLWAGIENDKADYATPEKYVPATGLPGLDWEVCHTMNESFGFSLHDNNWKTTTETIHLLCDTVSKGGNLLLNIGPKGDGSIPTEVKQLLSEVGDWMDAHSGAIYGTTASPFTELPFNGRCTVKPSADGRTILYFSIFDWPETSAIELSGLKNTITAVKVLGSDASPRIVQQDGESPRIESLGNATNPHATVIAVQIEGEPQVESVSFPVQSADGSVSLKPSKAWVQGSEIRVEGGGEQANFGYWSSVEDRVLFPFELKRPGPVEHRGGDVITHPGEYEIVLTAACANSSGGTYTLSVGDQKLTLDVKPTGGWGNYQEVPVGKVTFDEAGYKFLSIEPIAVKGGGLMNLRTVRLVPTWER